MRGLSRAALALAAVLSLALATNLVMVNETTGAPLKPFNRWGMTYIDGTNASGMVLTSWIDGVAYGSYLTTTGTNNTDIFTNGTDWNPSSSNTVKTGGEDGDVIVYRLSTTGGRLLGNEVDIFVEGGTVNANLNFTSAQAKEINDIKMFKVKPNPITGNQEVVIRNNGASTVTVNSNWKLKADGTTPGAYNAWSILLPNGGIASGTQVTMDLGPSRLNVTYGDIELCWKDSLGNIAEGEWVVMDRIEWTSSLKAHDTSPGNTSMVDKLCTIPPGWYLERKASGAQDTDNCEADFKVTTDSTGGSIDVSFTSPITGASWTRGSTYDINWTITGPSAYTAVVNVSSDGGSTYSTLFTQSPSVGTYSWPIPVSQPIGVNYILNIDVIDNANYSIKVSNTSGIFSIAGTGASLSHVSIFPPSPLVILTGEKQDFITQAYDPTGLPIDSGVTYTWTVFPAAGAVSPTSGKDTTFTAGMSAGSCIVNISAELSGTIVTNSTSVEVTSTKPILDHILVLPGSQITRSPGSQVMFNATGMTSDNKIIGGVSFTWAIAPPALGTITLTSGQTTVFTAGSVPVGLSGVLYANGTYNGTSKSTKVDITVTPASQVDHIVVEPTPVTIKIGTHQLFVAKAYDSSDTEIPGVSFSWSVTPSGIGTITSTGNFTAQAMGNCTVFATASGKSGSANVTVTQYDPWKVSYLMVSPKGTSGMGIGQSLTFTVTAYAANNTTIPSNIVSYIWVLSDQDLGTLFQIGNTCIFNSSMAGGGTITVTGTCNGAKANVTVPVSVESGNEQMDTTTILVIVAIVFVVIVLLVALMSRKNKPGSADEMEDSDIDDKEEDYIEEGNKGKGDKKEPDAKSKDSKKNDTSEKESSGKNDKNDNENKDKKSLDGNTKKDD